MPTVIDALVVTLGLDPAKFSDGAKAAVDQTKAIEDGANKANDALGKSASEQVKRDRDAQRTKDKDRADVDRKEKSAATERDKRTKQSSKEQQEGFTKAKNAALGFGAAVAGLLVSKFTEATAQSVAETGRLAHNLDMSTPRLKAWGNAIESTVGGSADAAVGSLQNLGRMLVGLQTGDTSLLGPLAEIEARSGQKISIRNGRGGFVDQEELIKRVADATKGMDPQLRAVELSKLGLDSGTINFMQGGRPGMDTAIADALKRGAASDKEAQADQALLTATANLEQSFKRLGEMMVFKFAPDLTRFAQDLSSLLSLMSGNSSWTQFKGERAKHWHDSQVQTLVDRGSSPADAEAAVQKAEAEGRDATARAPHQNTVPGLVKGVERFLGMPAGNDSGPPSSDAAPASSAALPKDVEDYVRQQASAQGLDPDKIVAQFRAEGGGYNKRSKAGAFGPSQLMPATARGLGVADSPDSPNYDWHKNADAGILYMKQLLATFGGRYDVAQAAYNAGPNSAGVRAFASDGSTALLPRETRQYVETIHANTAPHTKFASWDKPKDASSASITDVHIQQLNVNAPAAKDANAIAAGMQSAISAHPLVTQANSGLE